MTKHLTILVFLALVYSMANASESVCDSLPPKIRFTEQNEFAREYFYTEGDDVILRLKKGKRRAKGKIEKISSESLTLNGKSYLYTDLKTLKSRNAGGFRDAVWGFITCGAIDALSIGSIIYSARNFLPSASNNTVRLGIWLMAISVLLLFFSFIASLFFLIIYIVSVTKIKMSKYKLEVIDLQ